MARPMIAALRPRRVSSRNTSTKVPMDGTPCPTLASPTTNGAIRRAHGRVSAIPVGMARLSTSTVAQNEMSTCSSRRCRITAR
jgi:hypothetical protein